MHDVLCFVANGARGGDRKNNFGRNIVLQNLFYINIGASGLLTGSGANLLAAALITGATGIDIFFADWMKANFLVAILLLLFGYIVATRIFFPLKKEERLPQIPGGMNRLKEELHKLGKMNFQEIKSGVLFITILVLWSTDKYHGISPTSVAFLGALSCTHFCHDFQCFVFSVKNNAHHDICTYCHWCSQPVWIYNAGYRVGGKYFNGRNLVSLLRYNSQWRFWGLLRKVPSRSTLLKYGISLEI